MNGFLAGSLALIALDALLQPNAAKSAGTASNVLVALLRRVMSGEVAGVPNHAKGGPGTTIAEPPAAPSQGGTPIPIPNP